MAWAATGLTTKIHWGEYLVVFKSIKKFRFRVHIGE